ncbi:hypothetical protein FHS18_006500 [Paenibacillus phyllosphaerae]|uniref:Uncharacterized protein n=1 Tax=Paenibacillus phyllosphaerae TaxID=274593 RepID=A0A7W5B4Q8_9BACL|nr:hypothetical protein [Paenibacillus phyllosphaerae]MBB3114379.1 hypothetical protein [Paenibacillus phyllosphaerae]
METYQVAELSITQHDQTTKLLFTQAQLFIVTDTGYRLWYIDIDGMPQSSLLHAFNESSDLRVELQGITAGGRKIEGTGFLHPNVMHHAAAIRGDGELAGF